MSRVLVVSHDVVGRHMAGPGIRYQELTAALRRRGLEATLAAPEGSQDAFVYSLADDGLARLAAQQDAMVVTGPTLEQLPALKGLGIPVVVDLYDPFLYENLARQVPLEHHEGGVRTLAEQARCGDFFVCASERQRDLAIGMLTAWGRVNPTTYAADPTLRSLVDVVPFGLQIEPPRPGPGLRGVVPGVEHGDELVVWNGGLWDWLDPETAILAVERLSAQRPRLRLAFMGTRHPNPAIGEPPTAARARALASQLGLLDRAVFFRDWTPYQERGACLLEADAAVSLHVEGLETRFAFRTRLLDCIWSGLPTVATAGDVLGDELAARGLGLSAPPGDVEAVAKALTRLLDDPAARESRRAGFVAMAGELSWDRVVEPLARFLAAPRRAADRQADPAAAHAGGNGEAGTGGLWSRVRSSVGRGGPPR
jgi:glycosyltransferase involved in cell wall biosynthesis